LPLRKLKTSEGTHLRERGLQITGLIANVGRESARKCIKFLSLLDGLGLGTIKMTEVVEVIRGN
jgi:hypothetical protein